MVEWKRSPVIPDEEAGSEWLSSCPDRFNLENKAPIFIRRAPEQIGATTAQPQTDCALAFVRYSRRYCSWCLGHVILSYLWVSKNIKIEIYRSIILPVVLMRVKLGPSNWRWNIGWGCSRIGCCGRYLGVRRTRQQGSAEDWIRVDLWTVLFTKYYSGD